MGSLDHQENVDKAGMRVTINICICIMTNEIIRLRISDQQERNSLLQHLKLYTVLQYLKEIN